MQLYVADWRLISEFDTDRFLHVNGSLMLHAGTSIYKMHPMSVGNAEKLFALVSVDPSLSKIGGTRKVSPMNGDNESTN